MKLLTLIILILLFSSPKKNESNDIFIRCNQVGYLTGELKSAIVFSNKPLNVDTFFVLDAKTGNSIYENKLIRLKRTFGKFRYFYSADFSNLNIPGNYTINIENSSSPQFSIGNDIYNHVVDSLMLFFHEQRCGPTNPSLHGKCHLWDIARIKRGVKNRQIDVTGGWHDAGDYLKFISTTALTTYLLIFSYEFDKQKFGFDNNNNMVPDVLEEAKIGLDWLLRCNYSPDSLITQVQDLRDHTTKWRLPEDDSLRFDRIGINSVTKSEAGIYSAALALGARVWIEKFKSKLFAESCLKSALNIYRLKDDFPVATANDTSVYSDKNYFGKFELAATELFNSTGDSSFINDAVHYGDSAKSDYWWSYGDINSLAHYQLAKHFSRFKNYLVENISAFNEHMHKSIFNEATDYSWGTTTTLLGVSLQKILLNKLDNVKISDSLVVLERDFILGRNLWGITFIHNIGTFYPEHQHSQVGFFHSGYLPGALSSGPAPSSMYSEYKINDITDSFSRFNSDSVQYHDDYSDFISNEPTLVGNATALFVFGYYSLR